MSGLAGFIPVLAAMVLIGVCFFYCKHEKDKYFEDFSPKKEDIEAEEKRFICILDEISISHSEVSK